MSTPDIHAKELGTSGLPYLVKATLGGPIGNLFLIDSLIAITVCSLAVHAGGIRMIFTMGRDEPAAVRLGHREGARQVQDAADPLDRHRRAHDPAAGAERRQPARVLRAHLGRDHHVLHRLHVRHRAAADRAAAREVADARARPVLLAGPLGRGGEPAGRRLPDPRHDQPGLAARRPSTAPTTGTSSGARSPSPACSAASASSTTWPGSAAVRPRCWPSTAPRRSRSPTNPPEKGRAGTWRTSRASSGPIRRSTRWTRMSWRASPR